jgi:hypothetical protein
VTDKEDSLDPIIDLLREPAGLRSDLTERVMSEIERLPRPVAAAARPVRWWGRHWTIRVTPLHGLGLAAGLAGLVLAMRLSGPTAHPAAPPFAGPTVTQFVFIAPGASSVTVVGDFNDWSVSATPLERAGGVWSVAVPLGPGRYRYAFVVNGAIWQRDPEAPAADDEFGRANSVVTVGGKGT